MPKDIVISDRVVINAPATRVWKVLTDLERYPQWNPFTIKVESSLKLGEPVFLHIPKKEGSGELFIQTEFIEAFESGRHIAWGVKWLLPWIMKARRDQYIEVIDEQSCAYYTTDAISGIFAGRVMKSHGQWIKDGFNAVAYALKARVEWMVSEEKAAEKELRRARVNTTAVS